MKTTDAPARPIFISRSSTSVTLKMPSFHPKVSQYEVEENPYAATLKDVAVFGKVSFNNVDVALTNTHLDKTGMRIPYDSTITIKHLQKNEHYCFAIAGYNLGDELINKKIGQTTEDIGTYHPLPINLLYGYISKISFQVKDFKSARKASYKCCSYFMEKTKV